MGDFAAGKILDPIAVLLQLIEQKAPDLHATLAASPGATADALADAPVAIRPFLAAHDGGWEIYDYVLCSCADMAPSTAGLAIANHKFDEGDKLCLTVSPHVLQCVQRMCNAHSCTVGTLSVHRRCCSSSSQPRPACTQCIRAAHLCSVAGTARSPPQPKARTTAPSPELPWPRAAPRVHREGAARRAAPLPARGCRAAVLPSQQAATFIPRRACTSRPRALLCTRTRTARAPPCTARPRRTSPSSARRSARARSPTRTGGSR